MQTAAHKSAKEMVLKDLSYSGCGLILFDPFKGSVGDVVHFVFNAEVDGFKYNLNIYAKIVRIDCIGNKTMLGCAIVVPPRGLSSYLAEKQRSKMKVGKVSLPGVKTNNLRGSKLTTVD